MCQIEKRAKKLWKQKKEKRKTKTIENPSAKLCSCSYLHCCRSCRSFLFPIFLFLSHLSIFDTRNTKTLTMSKPVDVDEKKQVGYALGTEVDASGSFDTIEALVAEGQRYYPALS